jgi:Fuc2NAc and GlcNAc transferase
VIAVLLALLLSALLCGVYWRFALRNQILDRPNERSSHEAPTPHGGGAALIVAFFVGMLLSARLYGGWDTGFISIAAAALLLTALGVLDDLRGLSVRLRLSIYAITCLWIAVELLRPLPWLMPGDAILVFSATLVMLWSLNLYNFMDGIDGLAATQAVIACACAALLSFFSVGYSQYVLFCLLLAAAHVGFLFWNWPRARLFMGDAGSVSTGFLLAALAMLGLAQGYLNPVCWAVLLAAFITDATYTLLWRVFTGQPFTQPHRLHAYQRLARYWGSHLNVDLLLLALSALWLFPLAWGVQEWPENTLSLVILAYVPLILGMASLHRLA